MSEVLYKWHAVSLHPNALQVEGICETGRLLTFIFKSSSCKCLYLCFRLFGFPTGYIDGYFGALKRQTFPLDLATFLTAISLLTTWIISKSTSSCRLQNPLKWFCFFLVKPQSNPSIFAASVPSLFSHSKILPKSHLTLLPNLNLRVINYFSFI